MLLCLLLWTHFLCHPRISAQGALGLLEYPVVARPEFWTACTAHSYDAAYCRSLGLPLIVVEQAAEGCVCASGLQGLIVH